MEKGGLPALPGQAGQVASRPVLGYQRRLRRAAGFPSTSRSRMPKIIHIKQAARVRPGTQGALLQEMSKEVGLRQGGEGSSSPGRMAEEQSKYYTCPRARAPGLPANAVPLPRQGSVRAYHPSAGAWGRGWGV